MVRKIIWVITFLFISNNVFSQSSLITNYLAGAFDGTAETLKWHYNDFTAVFPNNNPQYWYVTKSWTNKYKNGDYNQGPKFPGSTTMFVWTTDGYHINRFGRNTMFVCTLTLYPRKKKNWKRYVLDAATHTAAYHLGFWTTYEVIFNN